jgi:hypothetical protein
MIHQTAQVLTMHNKLEKTISDLEITAAWEGVSLHTSIAKCNFCYFTCLKGVDAHLLEVAYKPVVAELNHSTISPNHTTDITLHRF